MAKYTKKDIEKIAKQLAQICKRNFWSDVTIYYNDKRICIRDNWNEQGKLKLKSVVKEDICPLDYFKYASDKHIISMAFEGYLHTRINYGDGMPVSFQNLFKKYGLYWEQGNSWNLTLYPMGDIEEWEYTDYTER